MLDSIYVAMTGLKGYSRGLRVIANNTANLNTPGFKTSSLQFADLFYSKGNLSGQVGHGLNTYSTSLNFAQGDLRQTGNPLDLAIDGQGLFMLKDAAGGIHYTRAGQFEFNTEGVLVNRTDGAAVMGEGSSGQIGEISLAGLRTNAAKESSFVRFTGNISSTQTNVTVNNVKVLDAAGGEHTLSVRLTAAGTPGSWTVAVLEGAATVGTGALRFVGGRPTTDTSKLSFTFSPAGQDDMPLELDFSQDVTSFASGTDSTLAPGTRDGFGAGSLSNVTFDASGRLSLSYTNGETVTGARLVLGRFDALDGVAAEGGNEFVSTDDRAWHTGFAGDGGFGDVQSGLIEISNVDLSQEFSDLVIMQRGYQASSQVVSTANDMLQELFSMKGK